jgi:hypothetical protein
LGQLPPHVAAVAVVAAGATKKIKKLKMITMMPMTMMMILVQGLVVGSVKSVRLAVIHA